MRVAEQASFISCNGFRYEYLPAFRDFLNLKIHHTGKTSGRGSRAARVAGTWGTFTSYAKYEVLLLLPVTRIVVHYAS